MNRKRLTWIFAAASLVAVATSAYAQTVVEPLDRRQSFGRRQPWGGRQFDRGGTFRDFDRRRPEMGPYERWRDSQWQGTDGRRWYGRDFDRRRPETGPYERWRDSQWQGTDGRRRYGRDFDRGRPEMGPYERWNNSHWRSTDGRRWYGRGRFDRWDRR